MSLGRSNSGKNRLANLTLNGRRQPSSPNDVKDSSKHSNSLLGRPTTLDEAVSEETTTGGIGTTDAPPLKEDMSRSDHRVRSSSGISDFGDLGRDL